MSFFFRYFWIDILLWTFSRILFYFLSFVFRHRKSEDDEMSGGSRCCFGFMVFIAQILLHGVVGLVLFWVIQYQSKEGKAWPFSWKTDPDLEFNLHPFLMIMGFIYFMGQGNYSGLSKKQTVWNNYTGQKILKKNTDTLLKKPQTVICPIK